jgi:hypothetical protein
MVSVSRDVSSSCVYCANATFCARNGGVRRSPLELYAAMASSTAGSASTLRLTKSSGAENSTRRCCQSVPMRWNRNGLFAARLGQNASCPHGPTSLSAGGARSGVDFVTISTFRSGMSRGANARTGSRTRMNMRCSV